MTTTDQSSTPASPTNVPPVTAPEPATFDFRSITGNKDVDQARALRIVLALIEDDFSQLTAAAADAVSDRRGPDLAVWELVIGMASTVAHLWITTAGKESTVARIREVLGAYGAEDLHV
jgi:hypothetical protein